MKTEDRANQAQHARLSEGMRLIFDQKAPSSRGSSRSRSSSSSSDSSYSSRGSYSSRSSRRSSRHRRHRRSPSSSDYSSSSSRSRSRSRSYPRCHRTSDYSRCRHRHSPPRRYRARSRSYSPSPDYRRYRRSPPRRYRAHSRSYSPSPSPDRYYRRSRRSRSRSRSLSRRRVSGFVGRYRCRFSPSPRRSPRSYRSRSRSPERSTIHLSREEKRELLKIAKENATKILGVQNLELPASLKGVELEEGKPSAVSAERVRPEAEPQKNQAQDQAAVANDDEDSSKTSPKRKPITFSINNAVAKPSSSPNFHVTEAKVTSRVDNVGSRKPYGQWIPVKNMVSSSSSKNAKH
ncbi:arginine/serine-rich protein 1 [Chanos chanos]|uniref:Arginine/serine-rich protein 1 n=1 Tax=Chanos chanos TaxID=29144 RepID=A0A6J2V019_CHACN|nr:arginine/serine-rich protein 1 [Chanos chanos]